MTKSQCPSIFLVWDKTSAQYIGMPLAVLGREDVNLAFPFPGAGNLLEGP